MRKWAVLLLALWTIQSTVVLASNGQQTWHGYVTDTHCGTNCQVTSKMKPDKHCIKMCIRKGSKYGLWSANHVYVLEPQAKAARFKAEDVEVSGSLDAGTIHIGSINRRSQE